jgi:rare lipoprotein A
MHSKTAAHKILPFNTYVKVQNMSNYKYTIVRINDRGPFVKGRIIDLSYAAAKEIDLVGPGTAEVKITALTRYRVAPGIKEGIFTVQIGAFGEQANAQRLADKLRLLYDYINITEFRDEMDRKFFRLHVSKSYTLDSAVEIEKKLEGMGFTEAFIVRL